MNKLSQAALTKRLEEHEIKRKLAAMLTDDTLNTSTSFSANTALYPNHEIPFVDKHIAYLMGHPKVDLNHYLSNLRLMLKKR